MLATFGYLHELGRLPDFLGGSILRGRLAGERRCLRRLGQGHVPDAGRRGLVADTLIGPVLLGGTAGFDGRWAWYIAVGRLFNW